MTALVLKNLRGLDEKVFEHYANALIGSTGTGLGLSTGTGLGLPEVPKKVVSTK